MSDVMEKLAAYSIVPVVVLNRTEDALPLAKALIDGGLPVAEVTFRTDAAEPSIKLIKEKYPEIILGAGTIINGEMCQRAIDAGASYIVSPGFSDEVVAVAQKNNVPVLPGCCTPTEVMRAINAGLKVVKFFPAGEYGGLKTIKALASVFPMLKFMPTGGVNVETMKEYLAFPKIYACGGSWMVKGNLISEGKFDEISALCKEAYEAAKSVRP